MCHWSFDHNQLNEFDLYTLYMVEFRELYKVERHDIHHKSVEMEFDNEMTMQDMQPMSLQSSSLSL